MIVHPARPAAHLLTMLLALLAAPTSARAADEVVSGWIRTAEAGGRVYPGGRQRAAMEERPGRVKLLVAGFDHENAHVGRTLARIAALAPEDEAVAALVEGLEAESPRVREYSAMALGHLGSAKGLPALTTAFRKGRTSEATTFAALVRIDGAPAREILLSLLSSYTASTRVRAAAALGEVPGPGAAAALVRALKDRTLEVRLAALRSLGTAGRPEDVAAVAPFLREKEPGVPAAAVETLRRLGGAEAREELLRHFAGGREPRHAALAAAIELGADLPSAGLAFATNLLESGEAADRARGARLVASARTAEATAVLREALDREKEGEVALLLGRLLVERRGSLETLRALLDRFPDRTAEALRLLDLAGDPELADRLRRLPPDPEAPAGGARFLLAFHAGPEDLRPTLDAARKHPESVGLAADAAFLAVVLGGADTVRTLVRDLRGLPAHDRIVVLSGPPRPGLRELHVRALRLLTGRVFGYAPNPEAPERLDPKNPRAFRRALRWWLRDAGRDPTGWTQGALEEARAQLDSPDAARREAAVEVLGRAGRADELRARLAKEPDPAVRVVAARWLVEADDPHGFIWLVDHLADGDLEDWYPHIDSPRPTRVEAARGLWRFASRRFELGERTFLEEEEMRDFVLEETRRWRHWWSRMRGKSRLERFRDGCRATGFDPGEGPREAEALLAILEGPAPRYLKENALTRLREIGGRRLVPLDVPALEVLAPGEEHPFFEVVARRWREALRER